MAYLKMPELNNVVIAGNLTKNPAFRETANGTTVVNFHIASNRKYKDSSNEWQEDVCYIGVVAWNKLADSCKNRLRKGNAVLIDGELQSRIVKDRDDEQNRTIIEIKAKRIQFLSRHSRNNHNGENSNGEDFDEQFDAESTDSKLSSTYEETSFDKFLTDEESDLIKD